MNGQKTEDILNLVLDTLNSLDYQNDFRVSIKQHPRGLPYFDILIESVGCEIYFSNFLKAMLQIADDTKSIFTMWNNVARFI